MARVHGREELCEMLSKAVAPPAPLTASEDCSVSVQQTTPATTEEGVLTFEVCVSLLVCSVHVP